MSYIIQTMTLLIQSKSLLTQWSDVTRRKKDTSLMPYIYLNKTNKQTKKRKWENLVTLDAEWMNITIWIILCYRPTSDKLCARRSSACHLPLLLCLPQHIKQLPHPLIVEYLAKLLHFWPRPLVQCWTFDYLHLFPLPL